MISSQYCNLQFIIYNLKGYDRVAAPLCYHINFGLFDRGINFFSSQLFAIYIIQCSHKRADQ